MEERRVLFLIKFGQKEYMENLFERGLVYMQRLSAFRNIEHCQIGDKNEGLTHSFQPNRMTVEVNGKLINDIRGPIRIINNTAYNPLIYCMYASTNDHLKNGEKYYIDRRYLDIGDTAILIKDIDQFLDMIKNRLSEISKKNIHYNLVEYVKREESHGNMGPFKKYSEYKHQSEFRFVFEDSLNEPTYSFEIGSLKKVAEIYSSKILIETISVTYG